MKKSILSTALVLALCVSFTSCREKKEADKAETTAEIIPEDTKEVVENAEATIEETVENAEKTIEGAVEGAKEVVKDTKEVVEKTGEDLKKVADKLKKDN